MIGITRSAQEQLDSLARFYNETKRRPEATLRLTENMRVARAAIVSAPHLGGAFPRPNPALASLGFRWRLVRIYWIAWDVIGGRPIVTNVFHVSADIEQRATASRDDISGW